MPVYLDCNATTPIEPLVRDAVMRFMTEEFGNAGSRTHSYGATAKQAVSHAREQVASVVAAKPDEVIFTSGATESNNLAILGLAAFGESNNRRHIITTQIEHKAVLEPLEFLAKSGFEVHFIPPNRTGHIDSSSIKKAIRKDTLLVSIMHVNNETGVAQPLSEIASILSDHSAFFHVDAAQGFGKDLATLKNSRIDLISISGHKIYAPKGIGALIVRRRGYDKIPLQPLIFGGGQERGLRPGTLPVPLIVGLGLASELALRNHQQRNQICQKFKEELLNNLLPLDPEINGDLECALPNTISLAFPGIDSEALMLSLKDEVAISNGSACTSHSYQPSHVLKAMNLDDQIIQSTIRMSWCHLSETPDWGQIKKIITSLK
jgi:cysteine desulfurase